MIIVTASGRTQLRAQPVSVLRAYLKAYGLSLPANVLEKEEIVDAVIAARVRAIYFHRGLSIEYFNTELFILAH